jgi:hypothetical protein
MALKRRGRDALFKRASFAVLITTLALQSCFSSPPRVAAPVPTDGVHITGAIDLLYPIAAGGDCQLLESSGAPLLTFSGVADPGQPTVDMEIAPFAGPGTYAVKPPVSSLPLSPTLIVGLRGYTRWIARDGQITISSETAGSISGTLRSAGLREINTGTRVDAAGSWTCNLSEPSPAPSPSPTQVTYPSPSPPPAGSPVPSQVLPPATVVPYVALCSAPLQVYQDGNAGPLFCQGGALNVAAWRFFAQLRPLVMSLGPFATLAEIEKAICAGGSQHITLPEEESAYALAAEYYGWLNINGAVGHGFDPAAWVIAGGCTQGPVTS